MVFYSVKLLSAYDMQALWPLDPLKILYAKAPLSKNILSLNSNNWQAHQSLNLAISVIFVFLPSKDWNWDNFVPLTTATSPLVHCYCCFARKRNRPIVCCWNCLAASHVIHIGNVLNLKIKLWGGLIISWHRLTWKQAQAARSEYPLLFHLVIGLAVYNGKLAVNK